MITGIKFFLGIEQLIDDDEANEDEEHEKASHAQEVLAKKTRTVHKRQESGCARNEKPK